MNEAAATPHGEAEIRRAEEVARIVSGVGGEGSPATAATADPLGASPDAGAAVAGPPLGEADRMAFGATCSILLEAWTAFSRVMTREAVRHRTGDAAAAEAAAEAIPTANTARAEQLGQTVASQFPTLARISPGIALAGLFAAPAVVGATKIATATPAPEGQK